MPSNHLILCHPLLLQSSIFPSLRVFSNESFLLIMWPKYWSFSFGIHPSNELFRVDFLQDWLIWSPCSPRDSPESSPAPQFKSINSLALSLLYDPTLTSIHNYWEKNHSFDYMDICHKVMSLLFNMLSRFVKAFLPRSKCLLISWLQLPSAVILDQEKKVSHCFYCLPIYLPWSDGTRCHALIFLIVYCWVLNQLYHSPLSLSSWSSSVPLHFLP